MWYNILTAIGGIIVKFKKLEFRDEPKNYYGRVPRTTAIVDTLGYDEDDRHVGRILLRFDIFEGNDNKLRALANHLDIGPVEVSSFEEGKALCNAWNVMYWKELMEHIQKHVMEDIPTEDNLEPTSITVSMKPSSTGKFEYSVDNSDGQHLVEGYSSTAKLAWDEAYEDYLMSTGDVK